MLKSFNILRTKFYKPPVLAGHVSRTRLLDALDKGKKMPLTIISAPAGFGKSVLASAWMDRNDSPCAWISLGPEENNFRSFLEYLYASINNLWPYSMSDFKLLLKTSDLPANQIIGSSFLNGVDEIAENFFLVLDDYHLIKNKNINDFIDFILRYPANNVHLVILTRKDPELNLNSLRAYGRINEISATDLIFNPIEIQTYFNKMYEVNVNDATVNQIYKLTEGWVTALRLLSLTINQTETVDQQLSYLANFSSSTLDILMDEVIMTMPENFRNLTLRISLLESFNVGLVDALLKGDSSDVKLDLNGTLFMEWLVQSSLFIISLDDTNTWFRFHHLFRDLLKQKLHKTTFENQIKEYHLKASHWYKKNDYINEAIQQALLAKEMTLVVEIIESNRLVELESDLWHNVERWLFHLPIELQKERPLLLLAKAWIYYLKADIKAIIEIVEQLDEYSTSGQLDELSEGELSFFKGVLSYFQGLGQQGIEHLLKARDSWSGRTGLLLGEMELFLALAYQMCGNKTLAMKILKKGIANDEPHNVMYLTRHNLGMCFYHVLAGNLPEAEITTGFALRQIKSSGSLYALCWADYLQSWVFFNQGKFNQAIAGFKSSLERKYIGDIGITINVCMGLALSYQLIGETEMANSIRVEFIAFAQQKESQKSVELAMSCEIRLDLLQGDLSKSIHLSKQLIESLDPLAYFLWIDAPTNNKARVLIEQGTTESLNSAIILLEEILKSINNVNFDAHQTDIKLLLAIAYEKQGNKMKSLVLFKEAVIFAENRGFMRPFLELKTLIEPLLIQLEASNTHMTFTRKLKSMRYYEKQTSTSLLTELKMQSLITNRKKNKLSSLTNREKETIEMLARGLRNQDIADEMFISIDAVKKHLYRSFQKLHVKNRVELINKVNELGILQD